MGANGFQETCVQKMADGKVPLRVCASRQNRYGHGDSLPPLSVPTDASDFGEVNACVAVASTMPHVLNSV